MVEVPAISRLYVGRPRERHVEQDKRIGKVSVLRLHL